MTQEEKAKELYYKMMEHSFGGDSIQAKKCALIAVDEVIEELEDRKQMVDDNYLFDWNNEVIDYWQQVKQEIENI